MLALADAEPVGVLVGIGAIATMAFVAATSQARLALAVLVVGTLLWALIASQLSGDREAWSIFFVVLGGAVQLAGVLVGSLVGLRTRRRA